MSLIIVSPQEFNTLQRQITVRVFGVQRSVSKLAQEHAMLKETKGSPDIDYIEDHYVRNFTSYSPHLIDEIDSLCLKQKAHVKRHIQSKINRLLRGMGKEEIIRIWGDLTKERKDYYAGKHIQLTIKLDWATKHSKNYRFFADRKGQTHLQRLKTGRFVRIRISNKGKVLIGGQAKGKRKARGRRESWRPYSQQISERISKERKAPKKKAKKRRS